MIFTAQLVVLLFGWLLPGALAVDFYITSPWEKIIWKAGDTIQIAWNILPGGPDIAGINLDLMDGNDEKANYVSNIAAALSPSATFFNWEVPKTIQNSDHYYIRISGIGLQPVYRYSNKFMLWGGEGASISINSSLLAAQPTVVYIRPSQANTASVTLPPPVSLAMLNANGEPIIETSTSVSTATSEPTSNQIYSRQSSAANLTATGCSMMMVVLVVLLL